MSGYRPTKAQKEDARLSVSRSTRIRNKFTAAMPEANAQLLANVACDLSDLRDVAIAHSRFLKALSKLRFPEDTEKLESIFIRHVEVELLVHAQWHLSSLKKLVPKFDKELEKAQKSYTRRAPKARNNVSPPRSRGPQNAKHFGVRKRRVRRKAIRVP